jgi:hypothetical protein
VPLVIAIFPEPKILVPLIVLMLVPDTKAGCLLLNVFQLTLDNNPSLIELEYDKLGEYADNNWSI